MPYANRKHIVVDFDGTLTTNDTTALLGNAGLDWQNTQSRQVRSWHYFYTAYTQDLALHDANWSAGTSPFDIDSRSPMSETLQRAILYQRSLTDVEQASAERVNFHALRSLPREHMQLAADSATSAGKIRLRNGAVELLRRAFHGSYSLELLSVNWSEAWVRACLRSAAKSSKLPNALQAIEQTQIFTNEIPSVSGRTSPLHNSLFVANTGIRTSYDKLQHLRGRREELSQIGYQKVTIVYIGDSATDIECLLEADIGMCVRDEPLQRGQEHLKELLEDKGRFQVNGISKESLEVEHGLKAQRPNLLYIQDFDDILEILPIGVHK